MQLHKMAYPTSHFLHTHMLRLGLLILEYLTRLFRKKIGRTSEFKIQNNAPTVNAQHHGNIKTACVCVFVAVVEVACSSVL